MKIVEPEYYILTPCTPVHGEAMLVSIEHAGRTCYKSEDKITPGSAEVFVERIMKSGHLSIIEHLSVSVKIICDRGVTHELVRHRLASYSQESTRYCNYKNSDIEFIHPPGLSQAQKDRREKFFWSVQELYNQEISEGLSSQIARGILPNALKTEIVMTANLREWRHIFQLRTAKAAHPQIREIMKGLLQSFKFFIPIIFDDIKIEGERECL